VIKAKASVVPSRGCPATCNHADQRQEPGVPKCPADGRPVEPLPRIVLSAEDRVGAQHSEVTAFGRLPGATEIAFDASKRLDRVDGVV